MRRLLPLLLLASGCAGIERPSELAPGPHLMLAGMSGSTRSVADPQGGLADPYDDAEPMEDGSAYEEPAAGGGTFYQSDPDPPAPAFSDGGPPGYSVGAKLRALEGKTRLYDRPVDDSALLKAAFEGQRNVAPIDDLISVRARTVPRREGGIKEGDLLFFSGDGDVPAVAVVHKRITSSTIEAAAVTRGAVRFIRITPMRPHARHRKGLLANSFLRPVRAGDPKGTAYLAGQLLEDVRVLVR